MAHLQAAGTFPSFGSVLLLLWACDYLRWEVNCLVQIYFRLFFFFKLSLLSIFIAQPSVSCWHIICIISIFCFFFSWESPSGPCAPKLCLTSSIPKRVRRVSTTRTSVSPFSVRGRVRSTWGQARRRPVNHMPSSNLWRSPSYVTKLWLRSLTAASGFSKWGMLFITGLSAAREKMIVCDSSYFSTGNTMPSCASSQLSDKEYGHDICIPATCWCLTVILDYNPNCTF